MADFFLAQCTQCGANVPLRLAGPAVRCAYCDAEQPLEPALAEKVKDIKDRVFGAIDIANQQIIGKQEELNGMCGVFMLVVMMSPVILFSLLLGFVSKPDWLPWGEFLWSVHFPDESGSTESVWFSWWGLTLLQLIGAIVTTLWLICRLLVVRKVHRLTLPRAPRSVGEEPRCRLCGADLPSGGVLRRCDYCGADHMLRGERYQKQVSSFAEAIRALKRQSRADILKRDGLIDAVFNVAIFLGSIGAIAALTVVPILLMFGNVDTEPQLLLAIGVTYGVALLVALVKAILFPTPQLREPS